MIPENLIREAMLGTAKSGSSEEQLLLTVCNSMLREQAGYVAQIAHLPLPEPCVTTETTPCTNNAMRYLRLMLKSIHANALQEWCVIVSQAGQHVQEDALPKLLTFGQKYEKLRPLLRPILGERGVWLAGEITNQNWKWVLETPAYPIHQVVETLQQQEESWIEQLNTVPLVKTDQLMIDLQKQRWPWSAAITSALVNRLAQLQEENSKTTPPVRSQSWRMNYSVWRITPLTYFFPLEMCPGILEQVGRYPTDDIVRTEFVEKTAVILHFRQAMLNAIYNKE
jgi:hypothetical protein